MGLGFCALLMWSLMSLLMSELAAMPIFQMTACIFSTTFLVVAIRLTMKKQWGRVKQPLWIWILGSAGICGSDFCYIAAFKHVPPAHIDFIDYLWPFMIILLSSMLPKEKLTLPQIVGGLFCVLGVYFLLVASGKSLFSMNITYIKGYAFALFGALAWSVYSIISRTLRARIPVEMYGMYAGIGAISSFSMHYRKEIWQVPSLYESSLIALAGVFGLAYMLWDTSVRTGNFKLLNLLAYFTPIMSVTFLVLAGKQDFSLYLVLACFWVICGVVIGSMDWAALSKRRKEKSSIKINENTEIDLSAPLDIIEKIVQ
jgi:drug/metabolite transporter (DMT)-like permease